MVAIRTILVPIDFDDASEASLDEAISVAKQLAPSMLGCHAVPFSLIDVSEDVFYKSSNASHRQRSDARQRLAALLETRAGSGVEMRGEVGEGIAWDAILGAIRQYQVDLVVLGTHGRRGLARGVLGSVAEHVVRTSP